VTTTWLARGILNRYEKKNVDMALFIPDLAGCSALNQSHTLQARPGIDKAASMSNAARHFPSIVIVASPSLYVVLTKDFQFFGGFTGWTFQPASRAAHGLLP
jgi:hypothetical protein